MTKTLPTPKVADFNDVLAGFERFGDCQKDVPDDLEGLEQYCEALAFEVSGDLMDIQNRMAGRDFGMGAGDDFQEAQSLGYALNHTATRILALAQIGVEAAFCLKELKVNETPGVAS